MGYIKSGKFQFFLTPHLWKLFFLNLITTFIFVFPWPEPVDLEPVDRDLKISFINTFLKECLEVFIWNNYPKEFT